MTSLPDTLERETPASDIYAGDAARMYHDLARNDHSEIDVLVSVLRHAGARSVLELGCGSGRITLPLLAALSLDCVALDTSAELLQILGHTLPDDQVARCRIVMADATSHRLARQVEAAVMGTSTISLFDARGRVELFTTTRANLAPGGIFVLTNFCWTPGWSAGEPALQVGASGAGYVLEEAWIASDRRRVTVRSTDTGRIAESEPWNLEHTRLVSELTDAGFVVRAVVPLHEGAAGRNRLIVAEVAR